MRVIVIAIPVVVAFGSAPVLAQTNGLTAACNGSAIAVNYTGYNFGDTPIVQVWRRNLTDCGPWTPLTSGFAMPMQWIQLDAVDTDVLPDKLYRYSVGSLGQPDPFGVNPIFYGGDWHIAAFVGCGNPPAVEGSVKEEWDGAALLTWAVACPGSCYPSSVLWSGAEVVGDYLNGDPVTIFGSFAWTLSAGWAILATSAQPGDCATIGVDARPWSAVKQMYR